MIDRRRLPSFRSFPFLQPREVERERREGRKEERRLRGEREREKKREEKRFPVFPPPPPPASSQTLFCFVPCASAHCPRLSPSPPMPTPHHASRHCPRRHAPPPLFLFPVFPRPPARRHRPVSTTKMRAASCLETCFPSRACLSFHREEME